MAPNRLREVDFIIQLNTGPEVTKNFLARKMNQRIDLINQIIQRNNVTESVIHFCRNTVGTLRILENLVHEDFNPLLENFGSEHFVEIMCQQYESIIHALAIAFRGTNLFKLDYETPSSLLQKLQVDTIELIKEQALELIEIYKDDIKLVEQCDANMAFRLNLPDETPSFSRLAESAIGQLNEVITSLNEIGINDPIVDSILDTSNEGEDLDLGDIGSGENMSPRIRQKLTRLKIALIRFNFIIHILTSDYGFRDFESN